MKIITGPVRSGKTINLILESMKTRKPILVFYSRDLIMLKRQAQELIESGLVAEQHNFLGKTKINLENGENLFPEPVLYTKESVFFSAFRENSFLIDNFFQFFYKISGIKINAIVLEESNIEIKKLELNKNPFVAETNVTETKKTYGFIKSLFEINVLESKTGNYKKLKSLRDLIRKSYELNHYIVSKDFESIENIMILSREMKLDINYPLTFSEFINKEYNENGIKGFLIENPQDLLQTISKVNISYVFEEKEIIENLTNYLSNNNLEENK